MNRWQNENGVTITNYEDMDIDSFKQAVDGVDEWYQKELEGQGYDDAKELIETFPFISNWISTVNCSGHLLDETVRMCRQVVAPKSFFFELICDISVECSRKHLTGTAPVAMSALSVNLIKLIRCYIKVGKGSIFFPL